MVLTFLAGTSATAGAASSGDGDFDRDIAPLIAKRCLGCHGGGSPKGMLDLSSRTKAFAGGESGPAIDAANPLQSLLREVIDADEMPPKTPLSPDEKQRIHKWLAEGAKWGTETIDPFRLSTMERGGLDWWSFQPLKTTPVPKNADADTNAKSNSIDAFLSAPRKAAGLSPAPPADKRTLIRRLTFDLTGLPPTPDQIHEYLNDQSDKAYENLVDRLLASPHYGERQARHWLDVVRFGESNGFEYDEPRDNAWHYRDWVINAFNRDMPYNEFVRMQIAGDILSPTSFEAAAATGFLVAGPHNKTVPANANMRMTMEQEELEDLVGSVGQTFLGLTVNCARCHEHKFDPITQKEYYQLASALSGVQHGDRTVNAPLSPEQARRKAVIAQRIDAIGASLRAIEDPVKNAILAKRKELETTGPAPPLPIASWEFQGDLQDGQGNMHGRLYGNAKIEDGALVLDGQSAYVVAAPLPVDLTEKTLEAWVRTDNLTQRGGGVISIQSLDGGVFDAIVFGEREPMRWMAGSNGFSRTQPFMGPEETAADKDDVHIAITYGKDGAIRGYRNGASYGLPYKSSGVQRFTAGNAQILFGLRHAPVGGNRMFAGRIRRALLYNRALTPEEIAASAASGDRRVVLNAEILARLSPEQRESRLRLSEELNRLQAEKAAITESPTVYTCVAGKPAVTQWLRRGDVSLPADVVAPGGLRAVAGVNPDFGLAPDAPDAARRAKLAEWITHKDQHLLSRVMVNRIWHYHFGQGLVATPSDFGFNGGAPSRPELLDWLAVQFRDNGYHIKPIHRLIVTSAAYRASSATNPAAAKIDADNRLLWRKSPQRLEAEMIRDAVLVITDRLNPVIGGKGYRDVRQFLFGGSNFYESVNESESLSRRRTIYRFTPRGGRNPFLDTFDCPDPSSSTPKRPATTTPLQSLALLNNSLIFEMSDAFAARVQKTAGAEPAAQIRLIAEIAFGRLAEPDEIPRAENYIRTYGLPAYCRIVLNSNEFLYIR